MRSSLAIPTPLVAVSLTDATASPEDDPPPSPESKALNKLLHQFRREMPGTVQRAHEQLAREFPGKEVAHKAAWRCAYFHFRENRLDKAHDLFRSLKRSGRENAGCPRP
jgi:hypothetical protein